MLWTPFISVVVLLLGSGRGLAVNDVPCTKGGRTASDNTRARATGGDATALDMNTVFAFAIDKATRLKMSPTSFKQRLAFLMPDLIEDSKNDAEWAFHGTQNNSLVREVVVVFANLSEKGREKWVFSRIEVTLHPDDAKAAFKVLRQHAVRMFKKPIWTQPNARQATALGWKLDSDWELVTEIKDQNVGLTVYQPTQD